MKKLPSFFSTLVIFCFLFQTTLFAEFVEISTARQVAENKIKLSDQDCEFTIKFERTFVAEAQTKPLFYVFELLPKGYVVISADTDLPPVIAYSFESNFEISENLKNPLTELLIADLQNRKNNIPNIPDEIISVRNLEWENLFQGIDEISFEKSYGPYIQTAWGQGAPYKNFCPMDPVTNERSIAGCPAVAMAQIINYYAAINESVFTDLDDYYHSYAGRNYWIDDEYEDLDFPSFPLLNMYLDTLVECWQNQTSLKDNEKAALNFACGVAAKQVYTSSASGTFGVNQAFDAYLRLGFNEAILLDDNDTSLYTQLTQNMIDGRPAHLAVVDEGWTMGHNVVVDGYDIGGFYHLNFGWNGSYNGYYLLPDEIPYGLTVIEGLILNIEYPPVYTNAPNYSQQFQSGEIEIFPNPANDHIYINYSISDAEPVCINIYAVNGALISSLIDENPNEGLNIIRLDFNESGIAKFQKGMYFCILNSNEGFRTGKFIVR